VTEFKDTDKTIGLRKQALKNTLNYALQFLMRTSTMSVVDPSSDFNPSPNLTHEDWI